MVKLSIAYWSLKMINTENIPAPPALIRTLVAGFDTITNHISLILFPIGLDLLIWFTPRLRLAELIERWVGEVVNQSLSVAPDVETAQMLKSAQELWTQVGERFNVWVTLRSYPVGIPSLMTSILPQTNPLGSPTEIQITSFAILLGVVVALSVVGLIIGTLFYQCVAAAVLSEKIKWQRILTEWPWSSLQVFLLALVWLGLMVGISIPASCVITLGMLGSAAIGQCATLIYAGVLIWVLFPLLFSAHGIFVNRYQVWPSIKQGIHITRLTLPKTSLFFLAVLLLSQGLGLLWRVPPEGSWLMILGLAGHAFITTGLLSASFIYYRDSDVWIRSMQEQEKRIDRPQVVS
jgi:hypothetical protein